MLKAEAPLLRRWPALAAAPRTATGVHARWWEAAAVAAVVLLALATRLYRINAESVWLDEAFSLFVAQQPLDRMLQIIVDHDTPPPLYYSLLHLWLGLAPLADATAARLFSATCSTAAVFVAYLLGKEAAGPRVGLTASMLVALSPFAVWYGQEARMYALLELLCGLSAYLLLRALRVSGWARWAVYTAVTTLALYTQISAVFFLAAEAVGTLGYLAWLPGRRDGLALPAQERAGGWARLLPWAVSQVVIGLLWLPWLPSFLHQSTTYQNFWIGVPTPAALETLGLEFTSAYLPHWRVPHGQELLVASGGLLALLAVRRLPLPRYAALLALVVVPIGGMYLVSQVKPIFLSRALIYSLIPYLVLVAAGLAGLPRWRVGAALLGVLVVLNVISLHRLYGLEQKEQWDRATGYVTARAEPGELVLFDGADTQFPFDYYAARQSNLRLEERGLPVDVLSVGPLQPRMEAAALPRMDELTAGRASFWLVESHTAAADPSALAREHAAALYRLLDEQEFLGVRVLRFDATESGAVAASTAPASVPASVSGGRD